MIIASTRLPGLKLLQYKVEGQHCSPQGGERRERLSRSTLEHVRQTHRNRTPADLSGDSHSKSTNHIKSPIFVQIGLTHVLGIIVFQFLGRIRNGALTDIERAATNVLELIGIFCPLQLTESRVPFAPFSHYSCRKTRKIVIRTKAFDKQHWACKPNQKSMLTLSCCYSFTNQW